jgi:anti-sigma factor RsiW
MDINDITDYDIQALVDNELDPKDAARVRTFIERNPEALKRYKALIHQKEVLSMWWKQSRH